MHPSNPSPLNFQAAIFDMDGVVTRTATIHARAWKKMFDDFLRNYYRERGEPMREFEIDQDYTRHVDGLPRLDGIRNFLGSRKIKLAEGSENDGEDEATMHGLAQRKNRYFKRILDRDGVELYQDTLVKIKEWREAGLATAIISSSRNCKSIIAKAGVTNLFQARVDGEVSQRLGLKGKPAPDIFLEAASQLAVAPMKAMVFEDAISGVQAGKAGEFGLVVGVARKGNHRELVQNGADITVEKLTEL